MLIRKLRVNEVGRKLFHLLILLSPFHESPRSFVEVSGRASGSVLMSVGLPSVCLSVPAVQEQKVCTASVDRQTHHNSLILSQLMSWEEERAEYRK